MAAGIFMGVLVLTPLTLLVASLAGLGRE